MVDACLLSPLISTAYFAMIGKGITFDAGGLNIKNAGCDIHEMHSDKWVLSRETSINWLLPFSCGYSLFIIVFGNTLRCGAANAFGAFVLAVRSGVKRNIVCALPLAEVGRRLVFI